MEKRDLDFTVSGIFQGDWAYIAGTLKGYGIDVDWHSLPDGSIDVHLGGVPDATSAKRLRSRGGGRRPQPLNPARDLGFAPQTRCADFLEWAEGRKASECAAALGVSRATWYRKKEAMEGLVEANGNAKLFEVY